LGLTGIMYAVAATLLGAGFLTAAIAAARDLTESSARRVFLASLLYHPLLMGVMLLDTARI
jgi:heme O synthase-like polyprenyltransferase